MASISFSPASGSAYTLSPTTQFTYDSLGRVLTSNIGVTGANTTALSYDALGRIPTVTNLLGSTGLAYYSNTSRISKVTLPNSVTATYTYADQAGGSNVGPLLTDITNANGSGSVISKFDYSYDSNNRITQWSQQTDASSPTHWNYNYDAIGQLLSAIKSDSSNTALLQYSYAYDLAGNRTSQQVNSGSNLVTSTRYNSVNQALSQSPGGSVLWNGQSGSPLYSVTLNGQPAQIDSSQTNFVASLPVTPGNNSVQIIAEDTHANQSTNNYTVNGMSGNTVQAPVYDKNGNTITDSAGNTYTYDAKGEPVGIAYKAGGNSQFTYYDRNRVGITEGSGSVKQFIFSGSTIAEEYDGLNITQPVKRFFGQGFIQYSGTNNSTATPYFYTRDHVGSTRELTNSSGAVVTRPDYDPYGVTSVVSGTVIPDFEYAGYYAHAASGLYLTKARFYFPGLGRWISKDPIQEKGGINLYAYCGNNPINTTDILGLIPPNVDLIAPTDPANWTNENPLPQAPNAFIFESHGTDQGAQNETGKYPNFTRTQLTPSQAVDLILKAGWDGKQPIQFDACDIANGNWVQQVVNQLGPGAVAWAAKGGVGIDSSDNPIVDIGGKFAPVGQGFQRFAYQYIPPPPPD